MCGVSFEFEYEKLNFLALWGFSPCIYKDKEIMDFLLLRKVICLFEISFASTKHLCSVLFDLHFYWPFFIDPHSALQYLQ